MRIAMRQIQEQEKLELATCHCGRQYWATEAYCRLVREGKKESLCELCEIDREPPSEDDNSVSFAQEYPDREPQENTHEVY